MRARTLILFLVALMLAGGTAVLVRSWLAQRRSVEAEAAPVARPLAPQKSVLVAREAIGRGQILKPRI
jgi:Flp pilus assembly protein CpaB